MVIEGVMDKIVWLVAGAALAHVVGKLLHTRRRVKEARVVVIRSVNDWQMHREFLHRRREAALYELRKREPDDRVAETHLRDRYDDEADALKLKFEREADDAVRGLGLLDRLWWQISNLWDRTHDREQELDWAARAVRGIFDEFENDGN